jgi:hypothetical protein
MDFEHSPSRVPDPSLPGELLWEAPPPEGSPAGPPAAPEAAEEARPTLLLAVDAGPRVAVCLSDQPPGAILEVTQRVREARDRERSAVPPVYNFGGGPFRRSWRTELEADWSGGDC